MSRKHGVDGVIAKLKAYLVQVEQSVEAIAQEIAADQQEDQSSIRAQLAELHEQSVALVSKLRELADRSRGIVESVEQNAEKLGDFVGEFEDFVVNLESETEGLDPDNWEWSDQENA